MLETSATPVKPNLELHVVTEEETQAKRQEGAEQLTKIAAELRALYRAEQNAGFEMGRLLCEVTDTTWLRVNLPLREERHDVTVWAKREVGLTYTRTLQLIDAWRVKSALDARLTQPTNVNQLLPLRPLLKHGREGRDLINTIWERACEESNRKEGPSRSHVAKIAKKEAPDLIGTKQQPRSKSKQKALAAINQLATKYDKAALIAALNEYLKANS